MNEPSFLENLLRESEIWVREQFITTEQRSRLLARYTNAPAHAPSRSRMTATMATLGALLVGCGIILFFESNWQKIAPYQKLLLLSCFMTLAYGIGHYLHSRADGYPRVSMAFHFLGGILYGATIFLIAQAYNITAHWPNGFLWWGLGLIPITLILNSQALVSLIGVILSIWIGSEFNTYGLFSTLEGYGMVYALWGAGLWGAAVILSMRPALGAVSRVLQRFGLFWLLAGTYLMTFTGSHFYRGGNNSVVAWHGFLQTLRDDRNKILLHTGLFSLVYLAGVILAVTGTAPRRRALGIWTAVAVVSVWLIAWFIPVGGHWQASIIVNLFYFILVIALLIVGYHESSASGVNLGLAAFGLWVLARYFDFAWQYMERSVGFLLGGLLLLLLGFSLERGRRRLLQGSRS